MDRSFDAAKEELGRCRCWDGSSLMDKGEVERLARDGEVLEVAGGVRQGSDEGPWHIGWIDLRVLCPYCMRPGVVSVLPDYVSLLSPEGIATLLACDDAMVREIAMRASADI